MTPRSADQPPAPLCVEDAHFGTSDSQREILQPVLWLCVRNDEQIILPSFLHKSFMSKRCFLSFFLLPLLSADGDGFRGFVRTGAKSTHQACGVNRYLLSVTALKMRCLLF